jgi:Omp85 superfamily domain
MTRLGVLLIFVSFLLLGFPPALVPICNADWADANAAHPVTEAAIEGGAIIEKVAEVSTKPNEVAPVPSNASEGSVPKSGASPLAAGTPAAAASPSASVANVPAFQGSRLGAIFQPDQWQWPHKFSLTNPDTWPFIPVPEIATDPNGGTTVGILAAVLYTDAKNQITDIFAPDVETNTTLGPGGNFRFLSYPSEDTNWYATAGGQEKIARRVDIDYQTGRTRKQWWSFEGRFYFEKDPTERFYGVGNDSRLGNETNYTTNQLYGLAVLGLNFTEDLQLALSVRPRRVRIQHGGFNNIPSIFQIFPTQKGIDGGSEVLNQAVFSYDTRDSLQVPRSGGLALAYFGIADRRFMSSVSYTHFGGELRRYYAINNKITLAGHAFVEYNPSGNETPFWSMGRLGGQESLLTDQETLRGYGAGRFIDNDVAVASGEVRTRVWDHDIFGTHGIVELAPFLDIGRVAHNLGFNPFDELHTTGGIGFRGIAEPFVVGFVDVGYGGEGVAVFSGINYPF